MEKVSPLHPSLPAAATAMARGNGVRPRPATPASPVPTFLTRGNWLILLVPRLLALRNGLRRRDRGGKVRALVLATLTTLFWCGTFWFFHRILHYFQTIPDFGPVLTQKMLNMTFLTFLTVLLFSNVITGLSTFFLSRDLLLLVPAPVPPTRLFAAKLTETLVDSSWMILLFSVPIFLAYGVVHGSGPTYYLVTLATVVPFLIIPAALGVMVTMGLAALLPAQRGKDLLIVFSALFLALLYMFLRLLQPEKLVNPQAFSDFLTFLAAMKTPSSPWLPSTWASTTLLPFLHLEADGALFSYLMLLSTALSLLVAGSWLSASLYPVGWSKAQEGRRRQSQFRRSNAAVGALTRLFPAHLRFVVEKDIKTFLRDTGQWSQLFQLSALIVVYVYNFSVLPVANVEDVYAFFNLALAGFVITSIAVRFVFPALSLEGKTFWVLKSAPLQLRRWWWSKFWVSVVPLLFFGEVLVIVTNHFLRVSPFMAILAPVTLALLTFAIVAMGMAVGIAYPNFTAEHSAKIAASYGGLLYMVLSISFIGAVIVLEAWPLHVIIRHAMHYLPIPATEWVRLSSTLIAAASLSLAIFWGSARWSIARLEAMEISL